MIAAGPRRELLERCLERLGQVASGTVSFETIVILDGADQGEAESLRARVQGALIEASSVELGLAGALNRARAHARGQFLVVLHDDAEVEPGWLETLVAAADADPGAGAVGSLVLSIDGRLASAGMELLPNGFTRQAWGRSVLDLNRIHMVDQCGSCSLLIRASTWDEIGGADERLFPVYYVDVDLCIAILARGQRVLCEPRSVVRHHVGASTDRDFARFVAVRNHEIMCAKWGEVISTHIPASGSVAAPGGGQLPRQEREPDPDLQERAQLERGLATSRAYAADLRTRPRSHTKVDRLFRLDEWLDGITSGGWRRLRRRRRLARLLASLRPDGST
jgi:GT2 family glycosyltransferase